MPSRFFRSPDSSGSETSDSEDDTVNLLAENTSQLDISEGSSLESIAVDRAAHGVTNPARDWLLSALLEERCYTQVRSEYQGRRNDEAVIQQEARRRFHILCSRLAPLDLVSTGLDDDRYIAIRQGIRDRLDSVDLTRTPGTALQPARISQAQSGLPPPLRRLLTDSSAPSTIFNGWSGFPGVSITPFSLLDRTYGPSAQISARYNADFEELGVLGKGGYGEVFHVKHRLDGRTYAVKKVPIRPHMIARIASEGEQAMDEILSEVRSLSRLDHPNVVRYFSSWIEWSAKSGSQTSSSEWTAQSIEPPPQALAGAESWGHSLHRINTESDDEVQELGITFESVSHRSASVSFNPMLAAEQDVAGRSLSLPGHHLALHMQMDVFPMTLADFIAPKPTESDIAPLCHCFHLETSLRLLQAILEGVEYLHAQNVVHRDLKPANIFLKHESNPKVPRSCVDLSGCRACGSNAHPAKLSVCIGDFGLVTNVINSEHNRSNFVVGTEIYRPTEATVHSNSSPCLDIFAAGIIFCELIHKFETQMERRSFLQQLRNGHFPERFASCAGHMSPQVAGVIADMLQPERLTIVELQKRLHTIMMSIGGQTNRQLPQLDESDL